MVGEDKKNAKFWAPTLWGSTPRAPPFGAQPFGARFWSPPLGGTPFGAPQLAAPPFGGPTLWAPETRSPPGDTSRRSPQEGLVRAGGGELKGRRVEGGLRGGFEGASKGRGFEGASKGASKGGGEGGFEGASGGGGGGLQRGRGLRRGGFEGSSKGGGGLRRGFEGLRRGGGFEGGFEAPLLKGLRPFSRQLHPCIPRPRKPSATNLAVLHGHFRIDTTAGGICVVLWVSVDFKGFFGCRQSISVTPVSMKCQTVQ